MLVVENLLRYMPDNNYQNRPWFDKVIAKIKWCSFFTHMVYRQSCFWIGEMTQNNGHYAVRGHSGSPISAPIESPCAIAWSVGHKPWPWTHPTLLTHMTGWPNNPLSAVASECQSRSHTRTDHWLIYKCCALPRPLQEIYFLVSPTLFFFLSLPSLPVSPTPPQSGPQIQLRDLGALLTRHLLTNYSQ